MQFVKKKQSRIEVTIQSTGTWYYRRTRLSKEPGIIEKPGCLEEPGIIEEPASLKKMEV